MHRKVAFSRGVVTFNAFLSVPPNVGSIVLRYFARQICFSGINLREIPPDRHGIFPPPSIRVRPNLLCYPTFCRLGIEFSAVSHHGGLVSPCEFASIAGGMFPMALCGLSSLQYLRHSSIFSQASDSDKNQWVFRHSARNWELNASMNALSDGFPGREKSRTTPR